MAKLKQQAETPGAQDEAGLDLARLDLARLALARRIRELRVGRGISGRSIAKEIGVTSGFISQIEQAVATPSVATLMKLAVALDVSMKDFFEGDRKPGKLLTVAQRVYDHDAELNIDESCLSRDPNMSVVHMKLAPGGTTGEEPLAHETGSEFIIVMKGRVTVRLADEEFALKVGDCVQFSGQTPHGVHNAGRGEAELLWVVTPSTP
jgi:transcriptional regulator with XRE-family HTH domain